MTVTYDPNEVFLGERMTLVRDLLRSWHYGSTASEAAFTQKIGLDPRGAIAIVDEAVAQGLFSFWRDRGYRHQYEPTELGLGLLGATPMKPMTRKRADAVLDALLDRCDAINRQSDLHFAIDRIWLFGSYLKGADRVNDIDVVVEMDRHFRSRPDRAVIDMAWKVGGEAAFRGNYTTALNAKFYLERRLVNGTRRHPQLSMHDVYTLKTLGCECKLVFDRARGGRVDCPVLTRHPDCSGRSDDALPPRDMPSLLAQGTLHPVSLGLVDMTEDEVFACRCMAALRGPFRGLRRISAVVPGTGGIGHDAFGEWIDGCGELDDRTRGILYHTQDHPSSSKLGLVRGPFLAGVLVERRISEREGTYRYELDVAGSFVDDPDDHNAMIWPKCSIATRLVCTVACDLEKIARHAAVSGEQRRAEVIIRSGDTGRLGQSIADTLHIILSDPVHEWKSALVSSSLRDVAVAQQHDPLLDPPLDSDNGFGGFPPSP